MTVLKAEAVSGSAAMNTLMALMQSFSGCHSTECLMSDKTTAKDVSTGVFFSVDSSGTPKEEQPQLQHRHVLAGDAGFMSNYRENHEDILENASTTACWKYNKDEKFGICPHSLSVAVSGQGNE
ncbi:hypothetical protein E2C01_027325 [Portunus trituberculatus]|uniref:Uncharacterized protein n=1 Tax=Portunus trituberculatus TaxID=210409 RepID=A0A5B7EKI8_PORTR|nr:hypothetical protein [Portunus trituberculatus]